jgi:hypothetical protein
MRMNGQREIVRFGAEFDREPDLADQVARMLANDAAAENATRFLIDQ